MTHARRNVGLLAVMVVCIGVSASGGPCRRRGQSTITICQLVENWKGYDLKRVRLRAIYAVGPVTDWLYDPSCGGAYMGVEFRDDVKGPYAKLQRLVSEDTKHRRAWVTIEGVFHGPEPYSDEEIARTPPKLRALFLKGHRRYGHMDMFDSMIEVSTLAKVSKVAQDLPVTKIDPDRKIFPDLP